MRIIAGQWRSRRLVQPRSMTTRPMPDRVKKAVFDMLAFHYGTPGLLPPLRVADVFAGSGSMGLEALSRGAAYCCFFERDLSALDALKRNLDALHVGGETSIVTRDAWRAAVADPEGRPFELIFLDPPYRDSADTSETGPVRRFLQRLAERTADPTMIVFHHHVKVRFSSANTVPWELFDQRSYGSNTVTFLSR